MEYIEKYGTVHWENEDIENALEIHEIEVTDENITRALDAINWDRVVERMVEAGWKVIYDYILTEFNEELNK